MFLCDGHTFCSRSQIDGDSDQLRKALLENTDRGRRSKAAPVKATTIGDVMAGATHAVRRVDPVYGARSGEQRIVAASYIIVPE